VVERLLGEEFFAGMARAYIDGDPPRSPVLLAYGEGFAAFLHDFEPVADLPYLPDVARVEWLVHRAYNAADHIPLDTRALSKIPAKSIGALRFRLSPSLGTITSAYPIYTIWRANTHDATVAHIGPDAGPECVLVIRADLDVELIRISPTAAAFIAALSRGETLSRAATIAEESGDFRLDLTLAMMIRHGAIAGIAPSHSASQLIRQETTQ
jgi:hypothetical protein